jgi:hypothetical protein
LVALGGLTLLIYGVLIKRARKKFKTCRRHPLSKKRNGMSGVVMQPRIFHEIEKAKNEMAQDS